MMKSFDFESYTCVHEHARTQYMQC